MISNHMNAAYLNAIPEHIELSGHHLEDENTITIDREFLPLSESLHVVNHSPTGFNWGYSGSGPAQLALAILLLYMPQRFALKYYQSFKHRVIAAIPQTDFTIDIALRLEIKKIVLIDRAT